MEQWKPAVGFGGLYEVSDQGRVRSLPRNTTKGGILRLGKDPFGYPTALLCKNGRRTKLRVHRMVLEAFIGLRLEGQECRHLNGIPSNNRLENLKWGTREENIQDKNLHGTTYHPNHQGVNNPAARLTDLDVVAIKHGLQLGVKHRVLAKHFSVSKSLITGIKAGVVWSHV